MSIRPLRSELQNIAVHELNENSERIQETLNLLREWIQQQPHLLVRTDDQTLITFVRSTKWRIQLTKEKIDSFYTVRTLITNFFCNRDPFLPEIQKMLKAGVILPLANRKDFVGPKICYLKFSNLDLKETPINIFTKLLFMMLDILLKEDDSLPVSGLQMIADYQGIPLNYIVEITPKYAKSFLICLLNAYPIRFNGYIGVNVPHIVEKLLNGLIKTLLNKKNKQKIFFYDSSSTDHVYNTVIDKSILPKELGGQNGSFLEITAQWKTKVENYRNWFLEDAKYGSKEHLRLGKSKYSEEEFGVEGTFRKLNID